MNFMVWLMGINVRECKTKLLVEIVEIQSQTIKERAKMYRISISLIPHW